MTTRRFTDEVIGQWSYQTWKWSKLICLKWGGGSHASFQFSIADGSETIGRKSSGEGAPTAPLPARDNIQRCTQWIRLYFLFWFLHCLRRVLIIHQVMPFLTKRPMFCRYFNPRPASRPERVFGHSLRFLADISKTEARSASVLITPVYIFFPHKLIKFQTLATQRSGQEVTSSDLTSEKVWMLVIATPTERSP